MLTATTEIYTLSLHDALPISSDVPLSKLSQAELDALALDWRKVEDIYPLSPMQQGMLFHALHDDGTGLYVNQLTAEIHGLDRSEEHTSELQSHSDLVCRLLLE